jgi:hypothetical protein
MKTYPQRIDMIQAIILPFVMKVALAPQHLNLH